MKQREFVLGFKREEEPMNLWNGEDEKCKEGGVYL